MADSEQEPVQQEPAPLEISSFGFALKHGGVGGVISVVATLIFFVINMSESPILQIFTYVLMLGIILWGQFEYRKAAPPPVDYGEILGLGVIVMLYFGVIVAIYGMVHWSFIDTGATQRILAGAEEALSNSGMPADQVRSTMEMQKNMIGPVVTPLLSFVSVMILGTIMALITSIFMRRKAT